MRGRKYIRGEGQNVHQTTWHPREIRDPKSVGIFGNVVDEQHYEQSHHHRPPSFGWVNYCQACMQDWLRYARNVEEDSGSEAEETPSTRLWGKAVGCDDGFVVQRCWIGREYLIIRKWFETQGTEITEV
jgi:hypothetical protein